MKASLGGALMAAALALPVWAQGTAGIPGVIAAGTMPELVQETFVFTEGPVAAPDGGLYFTDVRAEKIYRLDAAGKISVLVERSGGANGLSVNRDGEVFWVEGTGKRVVKWSRDGAMTALAASTDARPFLAPNDLMLDTKGGIYFTDPGPRPVVAGRPTGVIYLPPGSQQPVVLDDQVARPNGLTLTTDGKTLIVADTIGITLFAYDVQPDGTVRNKRTFAAVRDIAPGQESGADGIAIDRDNRLYVTTVTGVQVFDAAGVYLGTIKVARQPANVAFSGPGKRTLYITAREGLYKVAMLAQGPDRPGK
jgi:gluconolactonase